MTFLPDRIRAYLNERGISDTVLERNKINWDGRRIVIPIFNADGIWQFNKYRRDPGNIDGPKYTYDRGATAMLYGADKIASAKVVIICEGELDALILEVNGFVGVCSTGGAMTFKREWFDLLAGKDVYICFDNDEAGRKGMERVTRMRPDVKCIPLPREVGDHGDITDFFVKLGKSRKDFEILMKVAAPLIIEAEPEMPTEKRVYRGDTSRLEHAKTVPIDLILKFNRDGFAKCPFHDEKTASFHWIKRRNRWHCFGCGEDGDGIDLVMKVKNMTMKDAIDHLLSL